MSHFSTVRTTLKCCDSLVAGLRDVVSPLCPNAESLEAFLTQAVKSYDAPVKLNTRFSDVGHAEIVLSKDSTRHHSDIGFRMHPETGVYEMVADGWYWEGYPLAKHYKTLEAFSQMVQLRHDRHYTVTQATQAGFFVLSEDVDALSNKVVVTLGR